MAHSQPTDYNLGIPSRSPSPPQFREYKLWGESSSSSTPSYFNRAPQRPNFPHAGPRRYYHSDDDRPKSSYNDWPSFRPDRPDQRSMSFRYEQPLRMPPLWHNASQYDEQWFSEVPQRPDAFCRSPFQPVRPFSEDPQPLMSVRMQRPRFLSPPGRADDYCRPIFQPRQDDKDAHQFLKPTEPRQHQFLSERPDEHMRSPFPANNGFARFPEDSQSLIPQQSQPYRFRSSLQELNEHNRFPASDIHNSSWYHDEDSQSQSHRLRSPLQRPEHTRSPNMLFTEDVPQVMLPRKRTLSLGSRPELKHTSVDGPSNKMVLSEAPETFEIEEPKPELNDSEEKEYEVLVIERKSLYLYPDNIQFSEDIDDLPEPQDQPEQASTSSGSSGEWTSNNFKREGASPSHCGTPSRSRGQKTNALNKMLVKALSKPVKMDKGAKMMQRMGWIGGGLGKDGTGIVDPIAPNAIYATTTAGFGQEVKEIQRLPSKREIRTPCIKRNKNKKMHSNAFKVNVLLKIRQFATDDMQVEMYFEPLLKNVERKRIHRIVEAIGDEDSNMQFGEMIKIVEDIRRRCRFTLKTQSDGDGADRKLCVFKEAPEYMFLVTPDDCRPCLTDINVDQDEPNPFLKSIKKHIKEDPETASPAPPYLIDKLLEFFLEFCMDEDFTEFRFLGPFKKEEIVVINCYLTLIEDLSLLKEPEYNVPKELMDAFAGDNSFVTEMDPNGFTSIKKSTLMNL